MKSPLRPSFIIDTNNPSFSSILQRHCRWQVLCVVHFHWVFSQLQSSKPKVSFSPLLSLSLLIRWKSMTPLFCRLAWRLLMKSYLLWVIHLSSWAMTGRWTISSTSFIISISQTHTHTHREHSLTQTKVCHLHKWTITDVPVYISLTTFSSPLLLLYITV